MLRIAGEMVHPVDGLVIALVISLGDAEQTIMVNDQVNQVIEDFRNTDAGHQVELVTEIAVSISRGILDVARERSADVILLGVQRPTQGSVKIGHGRRKCDRHRALRRADLPQRRIASV